jgi:hypothetical protein
MGVVYDGTGNATNIRTDEDAAAWRAKYGPYKPYPGPGSTNGTGGAGSSAVDAGVARKLMAGFDPSGGGTSLNNSINGSGKTNPSDSNVAFGKTTKDPGDWRVSVSVPANSGILYYDANARILSPLRQTGGVVFPYVPTVTINHTATYSSQNLTHTNYSNHFYESSAVQSINITADFTVQNASEGTYFLAALYFFRAATKMFYGKSGKYQGSPPPIVYLDGYGSHYLPHVPCVVTSFSHTMPADVDYIETAVPGESTTINESAMTTVPGTGGVKINVLGAAGDTMSKNANFGSVNKGNAPQTITTTTTPYHKTRVPTASQFIISFQPVYSRNLQREFDYSAFARGDLINKGML